jgi:hypothetical protein
MVDRRLIVFKSLIRSNFDYMFIPLLTATQRIKDDVQKLQNRVLNIIQYFSFKTRITKIHQKLNVDMVDVRPTKLFKKFVNSKQDHTLIQQELLQCYSNAEDQRFSTLFDIILEKLPQNT